MNPEHKLIFSSAITVTLALLLFYMPDVQAERAVQLGQPAFGGGLLLARHDGGGSFKMCCNNAEHGDMKSDAKEGNNSRSNGTNGHNDWSFGNKHKEADKHERNRGSHKWLSERRRHLAFRALLALQLGSYIDQQPMTPAQTVRTYGYTPDQGLLLRVDDVRVEPAVIEPGKPSKLVLTYSILDPNSARTLDVSEVRQIFSGDELLKDIGTRTIERKPGTFETQQEVTFPADLPDGLYALKGKVGVGEVSSSGESVFRVTKIASRKGDLYALNKMFFVRW